MKHVPRLPHPWSIIPLLSLALLAVAACDGSSVHALEDVLDSDILFHADGQGADAGWTDPDAGEPAQGDSGGPDQGDEPDTCAPDCAGRACGDDGCGGSCGACGGGELCDEQGACVSSCVSDGMCDAACAAGVDPDCEEPDACDPTAWYDPLCKSETCGCHHTAGVCEIEAAQDPSKKPCFCDPDCDGPHVGPCGDDDWCDALCPAQQDPDCEPDDPCDPTAWFDPACKSESCSCDQATEACEMETPFDSYMKPCFCDPDCDSATTSPCMADAICDAWCPAGADPDCETPECDPELWYDPDCKGGDCACDQAEVCDMETKHDPFKKPCFCDPDCDADDVGPCAEDDLCDDWCPAGADLDCGAVEVCDPALWYDEDCKDPDCACDYHDAICEIGAKDDPNLKPCFCDEDCGVTDEACSADEHCDTWCPDQTDPDCGAAPDCDPLALYDADCKSDDCACDYFDAVCEIEDVDHPDQKPCFCDVDCGDGDAPCGGDGHCDSWCLDGADPDCDAGCDAEAWYDLDCKDLDCTCDYYGDVCEMETVDDPFEKPCFCDWDCGPEDDPCAAEGHCDSWCPDQADPDC